MAALNFNEAFTARAIAVIWNNYKNSMGIKPYLGSGYFPAEKSATLDLKWFKGSKGLPVSLTPSEYDTMATLRDRIGFKEINEEMPFFRESYLVKEKMLQEYENVMNALDERVAQEILKNIMLSPIDLIQGASVVPERMIWQLMAPIDGSPKISIHANGVNYDYNYDPDGSYKAKHFMELTGTDAWDDLENSDPLEDLRVAKRTQRKNNGTVLTVANMNDETFNKIVRNKNTQKRVLAQNPNAVIGITGSLVRELIRNDEDLKLEIVVYDSMHKDEAGKERTFIPDGMVSLVPGKVSLGSTRYGKTPEERSGNESTGELSLVDTGVAVYTFTSPHPIQTQTVVSEIVLPTYERMDDTFVIKAFVQTED